MRVALLLCLLPLPLRAAPSCASVPECLARVKLPHLDAVTLAEVGAVVAPVVIGVGALVTAAVERARPKADPEGVVIVEDQEGQPRAALELVPTPRDRYYNENPPEPAKPSGAFRFNDTATNVVLVAGGAALLGGIIAGIAKSARH
jgi:hypothetical protein